MLRLQCINFLKDQPVNLEHEGEMIRVAYLLSDVLVISGGTTLMIDTKGEFDDNNQTYRRKVIELLCGKSDPPLSKEQLAAVYHELHQLRSNKFKNKQGIVRQKLLEKWLDSLYHECQNHLDQRLITTGLPALIDLGKEEFKLVEGSTHNPETNEKPNQKGSEILKYKWTTSDEVYSFYNHFLDWANENNLQLASADACNEQTDIVTFRLPNLPLLNQMSVPDLKLIKRDVFAGMQKLREAIAHWSNGLKQTDFAPAAFGNYRAYFEKEISPLLETLQTKINANEHLSQANTYYHGKAGTEIYLGIAKAKTLWDIMEWKGLIPKVSMHVFMENLPAGCDENKAVLILLCKTFNESRDLEVSDKKSLQL